MNLTLGNRARFSAILLIACLFLVLSHQRKADYSLNINGIDVAVWLPPETANKPAPVIIFSHGLTGCNTQASFFTKALAQAGYIVFAPNHRDRACDVATLRPLEKSLSAPETWNAGTYADRVKDIQELLTRLPHEKQFGASVADWPHVGVVGISLGGYTALSLAGAWPETRDARIKAALVMVPFSAPFIKHDNLRNITIPIMYQGGTEDRITSVPNSQKEAYARTSGSKWYVEFQGAVHGDWNDPSPAFHASITNYGIAFLDSALKGKPFPNALSANQPQVAEFRSQPEVH